MVCNIGPDFGQQNQQGALDMLLSLVLFGSRARGDQRLSSDVDLLGVTDGGSIRDIPAVRGTSFFTYPVESIRQKAKNGDLFVLHLAKEGRIIHDTAGIFRSSCDDFVFKPSYREEITEASGIVWLFAERQQLVQKNRNKKRLAWALRTIIIAKAAEKGEAIFSSSALEEFSRVEYLKKVIDRRRTVETDQLIDAAVEVANRFGISKRKMGWPADQTGQERLVAKLGTVGSSTVNSMKANKRQKRANDFPLVDSYL